MAIEQTLSIIKPDAVSKNVVGKIISRFEDNGLHLVAGKLIHLTDEMASGFYAEHEGRPFFNDLKKFMTSGPVFVQVLEGEGAILKNRELMGSTNPQEADAGTIRADFAVSIDANAVHGSDSEESAIREINYFFKDEEILLSKVGGKKRYNDTVIWPIKAKMNKEYSDNVSFMVDFLCLLQTINLKSHSRFTEDKVA